MPGGPQAWRPSKSGVRVLARVTPKSVQDSIDGMMQTPEGPALKVRVRAIADKGAANRSVESVVAQWLGDGEPGDLQTLIAARVAALGGVDFPA